jgi:nitrogen fixation NifU-like protein
LNTSTLYTQIVLDHSRAPRNFGALAGHTHAADGVNPLCGDVLRVELRSDDGQVAELRFRGDACAVATAAASMLSDVAHGKTAAQIADLEARFVKLVEGSIERDDRLADLNAMAPLVQHPARRKCALLAFATLRAALAGVVSATTEGNP